MQSVIISISRGGLKKGDRYTHTTYGWRALVELMIVDFLGSGSAVGFC